MQDLLAKFRTINKMLQDTGVNGMDFSGMVRVIASVCEANCYLADHQGTILGAYSASFACEEGITAGWARLPLSFNKRLLADNGSRIEIPEENTCYFDKEVICTVARRVLVVAPILAAGRRLGTLVLAKYLSDKSEQDLLLGEFSAAVIGMEMIYLRSSTVDEQIREKTSVQLALHSLSKSERKVIDHILLCLNNGEGVFVASAIAKETGYTQSVVVNALRKLGSAGVVESRSLGVKGTYVKVLNKYLA